MTGPGRVAGPAATVTVPSAETMRVLGTRLAGLLRAGDLVILIGDLGAGKTTLVQGIGAGLEVRGPVTSPTFVIARVHPSLSGAPNLVQFYSFKTGKTNRVGTVEGMLSADYSGISVSPDGRWLLYSYIADIGSDLMMVENFR